MPQSNYSDKQNVCKIAPIILHISHASKTIPRELENQFIINSSAINIKLARMTDHYTDWLVEPLCLPASQMVIATISRLVVDMERFSDDNQEEMSKVGDEGYL